MTCHASKGLESDNVVILLTSGTWGFPNQIEDNQMLRFVLAEKDNHEFAEERRLFYVALTRAKKRVYILSKEFYGAESCFTKEIQSIIKKQEEKKSE
jgi:DNA helicase-4